MDTFHNFDNDRQNYQKIMMITLDVVRRLRSHENKKILCLDTL